MEEERRNRPDDGATGGGKELGYASSATTGATMVKVECIFMATIGIKLRHPGDRWDTLYRGQRVGRASWRKRFRIDPDIAKKEMSKQEENIAIIDVMVNLVEESDRSIWLTTR